MVGMLARMPDDVIFIYLKVAKSWKNSESEEINSCEELLLKYE